MKASTQPKQNSKDLTQPKADKQASNHTILQAYKSKTAQFQTEEEELVQGKFETAQLATEEEEEPLQRRPNNTGLPDNLKSGIENLSGYSMDDVKVHYNSSQPATLLAHAYAQGTDIHVAPGQEKYLPHEAWHVVQQKQGRVQPTKQLKGKTNINDDAVLEKEADVMGAKVMQMKESDFQTTQKNEGVNSDITQLQVYTMKRDLPLTKKVKEKNGSDAWIKYIDALKRKHPLPEGKVNDEDRGPEFNRERESLRKRIDIANTKKDYQTTSAHVAGIDMGDRKRIGSGANKIKKIAGNDWIGAHLVKDAWGGMDNMMNVVAWPQEAEDSWSGGFEDQIDDFFLDGLTETGRIYIEVSKEDELISSTVVKSKVEEKKTKDEGKDKWLLQEAEKKRWEINNAIETVPYIAIGKYQLDDKASEGKVFKNSHQINNDLTGFDYARGEALKSINESIEGSLLKAKSLHVNAVRNAKGQEDIANSEKALRSKARTEAIIAEFNNLNPTEFSENLENIPKELFDKKTKAKAQ